MIRGSLSAVAIAALLSTSAFAQESGTTTTTTTSGDSMRSPGGLYDATPHTRKSGVTIFGNLAWGSGLGLGGRFTLPLVADGFLAEINDSIELEFGGDFYFLGWFGYTSLDIPVEARWTFHILPNFSAYAKVAIGAELWFQPGGISFWPLFNIGPGIAYRLGENFVLRAEAGNRGLRVGATLEF